ncbi:hypothetical protein D3C86_2214590 [compost metagenome]
MFRVIRSLEFRFLQIGSVVSYSAYRNGILADIGKGHELMSLSLTPDSPGIRLN